MSDTVALLLDLDRTLVDVETYVDYCAALRDLRVSFPDGGVGLTPETTGWGSCTKEVIARLVALAGEAGYPPAAALVAQRELEGAPGAQAMPGLAPFLEAIADRRTAVVTLLGPEATALVLDQHDIEVDAVVPRRPDLKPKPFRDQVDEALRLIDVEAADAVMIGDSATDLVAAESAGVRFIGITNGRDTPEFDTVETAQNLEAVLGVM